MRVAVFCLCVCVCVCARARSRVYVYVCLYVYYIHEHMYTITWQVLTALRHLHLRRIVHCDLKPENILCHEHRGRLKLKLADWGFAQVSLPACAAE